MFEQVLELDDEDDDEEEKFSKGMVEAYYVQADKAFNDMDGALCAFSAPCASFL